MYFLSNLPANIGAIIFSISSIFIKKEKKMIKFSLEIMIITLALMPIFSYLDFKNGIL